MNGYRAAWLVGVLLCAGACREEPPTPPLHLHPVAVTGCGQFTQLVPQGDLLYAAYLNYRRDATWCNFNQRANQWVRIPAPGDEPYPVPGARTETLVSDPLYRFVIGPDGVFWAQRSSTSAARLHWLRPGSSEPVLLWDDAAPVINLPGKLLYETAHRTGSFNATAIEDLDPVSHEPLGHRRDFAPLAAVRAAASEDQLVLVTVKVDDRYPSPSQVFNIDRVPLDGTPGTRLLTLPPGVQVPAIAIANGVIFAATATPVVCAPGVLCLQPVSISAVDESAHTLSEVAQTTVLPPMGEGILTSDGASLFWVDVGDTGPESGSIVRFDVAAQHTTVLAGRRNRPSAIVADGPGFYWSEAHSLPGDTTEGGSGAMIWSMTP